MCRASDGPAVSSAADHMSITCPTLRTPVQVPISDGKMSPMNPDEHTSPFRNAALPVAVREVEDFIAGAGWDQAPQLFALVPTAELLAAEPSLADRLFTP